MDSFYLYISLLLLFFLFNKRILKKLVLLFLAVKSRKQINLFMFTIFDYIFNICFK